MVAEKPLPEGLSEDQLIEEMAGFLGDQYQTPPMFSAKKIDGVPLYKMARKGKTVEREPRFIRINELKLENWESPLGKFFMDCSKGTYVRTVVHDLGQRLDVGHIYKVSGGPGLISLISPNLSPLSKLMKFPWENFKTISFLFAKRFQPMFFNDGAGL